MLDDSWKKFILKIKREQPNADLKKPTSDSSIIYLCRVCSSFKSHDTNCLEDHLYNKHGIRLNTMTSDYLELDEIDDDKNASMELDSNLMRNDECNEPLVVETDFAEDNPPLIPPQSPLSPIVKEVNSSGRKKVMITLNTSPLDLLEQRKVTGSNGNLYTDCESNNNIVSSNAYDCSHCGRIYTSKTTLERHLLRLHEKNNQHTDADEDFKKSTAMENQSADNILHFYCEPCGRAFTTKHAYKQHSKLHREPNGRYTCSHCSTPFVSFGLYKKHCVNVHNFVPSNNDDVDYTLPPDYFDGRSDSSDGGSSAGRLRHRTSSHSATNRRGRSKKNALGGLRIFSCHRKLKRGLNKRTHYDKSVPSDVCSFPMKILDTNCTGDNQEVKFSEPRFRTILPKPPSNHHHHHHHHQVTKNQLSLLDLKHRRRPRRPRHSKLSKLGPSVASTGSTSDTLWMSNNLASMYSVGATDSLLQTAPSHVLTVAAAYASQLPVEYMDLNTYKPQQHDLLSTASSTIYEVPNSQHLMNTVVSSASINPMASGLDQNSVVHLIPETECSVGDDGSMKAVTSSLLSTTDYVSALQLYPTSQWSSEHQPADTPSKEDVDYDAVNRLTTTQQSVDNASSFHQSNMMQLYPVTNAQGSVIYYYIVGPNSAHHQHVPSSSSSSIQSDFHTVGQELTADCDTSNAADCIYYDCNGNVVYAGGGSQSGHLDSLNGGFVLANSIDPSSYTYATHCDSNIEVVDLNTPSGHCIPADCIQSECPTIIYDLNMLKHSQLDVTDSNDTINSQHHISNHHNPVVNSECLNVEFLKE